MKTIKLEEQFKVGEQIFIYTLNEEGKGVIKTVKKGTPAPKKPEFIPPTCADCIVHFHKKGYDAELAKQFFEYYESAQPSWHDKNGKPVKNWVQKSIFWMKDQHKLPVKQKAESGFMF